MPTSAGSFRSCGWRRWRVGRARCCCSEPRWPSSRLACRISTLSGCAWRLSVSTRGCCCRPPSRSSAPHARAGCSPWRCRSPRRRRGAASPFGLFVLPLQVASADEVSVEAAVGTLVPLTATLAVIVRLFSTAFDPIRNDWVPVVSVSSGLLMLGGAVGALVQARLQRAVGWLGVTYAGIVLAALVPTVRGGTEAALLLMVGWTGALACAVVAVTTVPGRDAPGPLA